MRLLLYIYTAKKHFWHNFGTVRGKNTMAAIRKKGDYQWHVQIRKKGFAPLTKTFETKAAAELWAKTTESEMGRGVFVSRAEAEATTLRDALTRYAAEISPSKKGCAQEIVRINKWLTDPLANRALASLKSTDFAKWRDARLKSVSPATLHRDLSIISHLFSICNKEWGIAVTNPLQNIRKPSIQNARDRRLEGDEEQRLLDALSNSGKGALANHWMQPLAVLAIETAMRQGELLKIQWKDVDLKKSYVHLADTKNGTARDVPLSNRAKATLEALPRSIDGKVLGTTQSAVVQAWARACKRARITDLTFHDLRHEATSRMAEKLALHELMKVTGHKDTKMLARYYHPRPEDLARKLG
jgi:integrase